jgi:uncharacterized integral membrane protein
MKLALVAAIALSVVMAFFAVQNSQVTRVAFLGWYFDASLVIVLLLTFGAGALSAFLAVLPGSLRKSFEISKLRKLSAENAAKLEATEQQLKTVKSQQTTDKDASAAANTQAKP